MLLACVALGGVGDKEGSGVSPHVRGVDLWTCGVGEDSELWPFLLKKKKSCQRRRKNSHHKLTQQVSSSIKMV